MRRSPVERLIQKVKREFNKCTYIGDIQITDDEYVILKKCFELGYSQICKSPSHETINPLFAVALVQVGIRFYDGKFWPHVKREFNIDKLDGVHQGWIGRSFYKTLCKYGKFHVEENELINNILLHCFITKYYADDLFDFLFAYYQIDLDRDLSRNNPDMRRYLMESMKKGEASARAYKIKKHTADAVSVNEKGCKLRVARILRLMDNALFHNIYPITSQNRISQMFCLWAKSSDKFDIEKKRINGLNRYGTKRYSTPYIHFNGKNTAINLVLPPQYIRLEDEEEIPHIAWRVIYPDSEYSFDVDSSSCVTGCKTSKVENVILPKEHLFEEIKIELWKNNEERIQKFKIKPDTIRFFDRDWDMMDSAIYSKYLPSGQAFAFTQPNEVLMCDANSIIGVEKMLGYDLYTLDLKKGDVIRLPDGRAKSIGKPLEEGVLQQNLVSGAYAMKEGVKYTIYSSIPSIYFRMHPAQEKGTLLIINGERHHLDLEQCVFFSIDEETKEKGYVLQLNNYIGKTDFYDIIIDIPNNKKERRYSFAYIKGFGFEYDGAPYIFKEKGVISFADQVKVISTSEDILCDGQRFVFNISPIVEHLTFFVDSNNKRMDVRVYLPVFKWSFDGKIWDIYPPNTIWYEEIPNTIYFKHPDSELTFCMDPLIGDDDDLADQTFELEFSKKAQHYFECDTRRILSWLGNESTKRVLYIRDSNQDIPFLTVLTGSYFEECQALYNEITKDITISASVEGRGHLAIDIYYEDQCIIEKEKYDGGDIHLFLPNHKGHLQIVLYEQFVDEFFDDEIEYRESDRKILSILNPNDYSGKSFVITQAELLKTNVLGRFEMYDTYYIFIEKPLVTGRYDEYKSNLYIVIDAKPKLVSKVIAKFVVSDDITTIRLESIDERRLWFEMALRKFVSIDMSLMNMVNQGNRYRDVILFKWFYKETNFNVKLAPEEDDALDFNKFKLLSRKYNWPVDKTDLPKNIKKLLEKEKIFSTDSIITYGVTQLLKIPKMQREQVVIILEELKRVGYIIQHYDELVSYYKLQ